MKIHEYQGKELFRQAGVPVLAGIVAKTADQAAAAYEKLGGKIAVVKSQIHAGGRGKGTVKDNPDQRGVVVCKSADEVRGAAEGLLGNTLVTIQTGPEGKTVNQVFVEAGCDIDRDLADLLVLVQYRLERVLKPVDLLFTRLLLEGSAAIVSILVVTLALWWFVKRVSNGGNGGNDREDRSPTGQGPSETVSI